jgi:hypothetical protein
MPPGFSLTKRVARTLDFGEVEAYKCFTPAEYDVVARIVIDYRWFWDYAIRMEQLQQNHEQQIRNLELQLQLWQDTTKRVDESRLLAVELLKEERSTRLEIRSGTKLALWLTGGAAIVAAIVAGGFAGAYAVERQ